MKIYIVTEGWYSDYHIIAVFDSEELAQECVDFYGGDAQIEEYDLNDYNRKGVPQGLFAFDVNMDRSGNSHFVRRASGYSFEAEGAFHYDGQEWELEARVHARDEEHAVKVANEKRTHLIALDRWPYPDNVPDRYMNYMTIDDWGEI